jgi:hypothetical protein
MKIQGITSYAMLETEPPILIGDECECRGKNKKILGWLDEILNTIQL